MGAAPPGQPLLLLPTKRRCGGDPAASWEPVCPWKPHSVFPRPALRGSFLNPAPPLALGSTLCTVTFKTQISSHHACAENLPKASQSQCI